MSTITSGTVKWCIENGAIRFSDPLEGTLEVVSRVDIDPTVFPALDDSIFSGDEELIRLFYAALRDFVAMKIAHRSWMSEHSDLNRRNSLRQTFEAMDAEFKKSFETARCVQRDREARVTRFQPIVGVSVFNRRISDWS